MTNAVEKTDHLLITGAAGALGQVLRQKLKPYVQSMRLSDIAPMAPAADDYEETVICDLADKAGVNALCRGMDAVLHLGGISVEHSFEDVLGPNIVGAYHIYEAARRNNVPRVIFASSNHVVGFHPQGELLQTDCARRPDGCYGLSKSFGEDVARFYFDRYGIESACLRIGSAFPEPKDRRMLMTWLSFADLAELVRCCLVAPDLGCTVVWGVSANRDVWWDNAGAAKIGFQPKDSSEPFRAKVEAAQPPLPDDDPVKRFQGGAFVKAGPYPAG